MNSGFPGRSPIMTYFEKNVTENSMTIMIDAKFLELAEVLEANLPGGPEKTVALRKLLEAKHGARQASL